MFAPASSRLRRQPSIQYTNNRVERTRQCSAPRCHQAATPMRPKFCTVRTTGG